MKKLLQSTIIFVFAIALIVLTASCKKDKTARKENFETSLITWYRVSPATPSTITVNNTAYVSLANLIVSGEGNTNNMGSVKSYANTTSYSTAANGAPMGAIGAPVKEIPSYPVLGAALPLLQSGDFSEVPGIVSKFEVPESVNGHTVNLVLFNIDNDALFLSNIPGTGTATSITPTVGGYTNKVLVVGGTGKFKNASGELNNTGHFSFVAPFNGEDNYEGWISYE